MTNAIELNHISKSFGEFSLKNVTLAIPAGTICGLWARTARANPP